MSHRSLARPIVAVLAVGAFVACSEERPVATGVVGGTRLAAPTENAPASHAIGIHGASQSEDKGYIDGWFDGREVQLYYTKSYFCASRRRVERLRTVRSARHLKSVLGRGPSRPSMQLPRWASSRTPRRWHACGAVHVSITPR